MMKYQVGAVPHIVINETYSIEGAIPEPLMVEAVLKALGKDAAQATTTQAGAN